ncbi:MAG: hypothetical protein D6696_19745 [Acidobacteria bacterium]|nr:MAG: hypothetical protein D6696_19745 [Acidobacteriota bacterium]
MSHGRAAALLAILCLVLLGTLLPLRAGLQRVWGDEGTFLAMAESLVHDRDLAFDERDRRRLLAAAETEPGAGAVILERDDDGTIAFSKPILYPLAAAPFVALFGDQGPALLNALLLALALALAHAFLSRWNDPGRSALVVVTFAGASVLLPYVLWRMSDVMQAAFTLAGLALSCAALRPAAARPQGRLSRLLDRRWAPCLGAVLLGLTVAMRVTNAALAAVPVLAHLFARRRRRAVALAASAALAYLAAAGLTWQLTGHPDPYRAPRTSFTAATGYPAGPEAAAAERFDRRPATHHRSLAAVGKLDRVAYSAAYFWLGRHTGLAVYFPAALALLAAALRRPDALGRAALLAFAACVAFFVGWLPENYFGGHTFIGNRYLLTAYAALLVAPRRLPGRRLLFAVWGLAFVAYASALWSTVRCRGLDVYPSQSHAHAGLFRLLPYESTAQDLMSRDRYWSGAFLRFVDPFAELRPWHAVLDSGRPAAEVMIARWQPAAPLRLVVETDAPEAWLTMRDYAGRESHPVGAGQRRGGFAVVDLAPSRPWRYHRFWFFPEQRYRVHLLRLALHVPHGRARARLYYLDDPALLEQSFAYERRDATAADECPAGGRLPLSLRLRNASPRTWLHEGVTPVYLKLRWHAADGDVAGESAPFRLPAAVAPGQELGLEVEADCPAAPGPYRLEADLLLARVGWFAERLGEPILHRPVEVLPAPDDD